MATAAAAGEVWEVVLEGRQEGQQVLNVLYFRMRTSVDNVELRLLRALVECLLDTFVPAAASTYQYVRCHGKRVTPDVGPVVEIGTESGDLIQGATEGDAEPSFVSVCVNIHTTRGGRSGRGRMFLPAVPEGATTGSFVQTTQPYWLAIVAYLACVAGKFIHAGEPIGTNEIELGVMSRKIGGIKAPFLAAGFAAAVRLVPLNRLSHNVSRKVGRGS